MNLENMSQQEKDALLADLLQKKAQDDARARAEALGLSWSKQGFVVVKQGKLDDGKNLPALYIHPKFLNELDAKLNDIKAFALTGRV